MASPLRLTPSQFVTDDSSPPEIKWYTSRNEPIPSEANLPKARGVKYTRDEPWRASNCSKARSYLQFLWQISAFTASTVVFLTVLVRITSWNRTKSFMPALCFFMQGFCILSRLFSPEWDFGFSCQKDYYHESWNVSLQKPLTIFDVGPDFAFDYNGGRIIPELTATREVPSTFTSRLLAWMRGYEVDGYVPPRVIIEDLVPGECWMLPDATGHVGIALSKPTFITHIAIHYPPPTLLGTLEFSRAPRRFAVWEEVVSTNVTYSETVFLTNRGWKAATNVPSNRRFGLLSEYSYDARVGGVQIFTVPSHLTSQNRNTTAVFIEILDNWGSNTTCLYRISIHSQE
ncbi:hypothetical protein VKT23_012849 [Stygiomarasmius scandens]|uniref:SUN domain-containing protein n=1 Tax=Marasmiellus scandens TaxID=2682957 RepID=A0ABR1J563_9AGAR